jgi:peptidoglycan/LPS O-acetylase OafA/YrhL
MTGPVPGIPVVTSSSRLRSLDGLRGIAAAIVVLHHAGLLNPGISDIYLLGAVPAPGSFAAIVTRTPLQLLFSGQEAVLIFFVLSGLVVAIPPIDRPSFSWIGYYPRRVVRLMLPVIGSVALAIVIVAFTLRDPTTAVSGWAAASTFAQLSWQALLADFDVLLGGSAINNPLWSLRQELLFSLMLPLYVVVAVVARNRWWIAAIGVAVVVLLGELIGDPFWIYLPVFLLGTLAAVHRDALATFAHRLPARRRNLAGAGLLVLGLVLLEMRWIVAAVHPGSTTLAAAASTVVVFGAALLVLLALVWGPMIRTLELGFVAWLGRISFSLYLVHVPILVATSSLLRGLPWYWAAIVGIPIAVGVAVLFDRFVERPSHRLSQRVGRTVDARFLPAARTG